MTSNDKSSSGDEIPERVVMYHLTIYDYLFTTELKMGWFGVTQSLKITPFDRAHISSFLLVSNYVPILHRF